MPNLVSPRSLRVRLTVLASFLLLGATILTGCGCGVCASGEMEKIPHWYLNTPKDPHHVYAVAHSAKTAEMQESIDEATAKAHEEFAARLDTVLGRRTQAFVDTLDGTLGREFAQVRRETMGTLAEKTSPKEMEVYEQDDGTWRAFVLMAVPLSKAAQALSAKLEQHEEVHARFRKSPAYREMAEGDEKMNESPQER